MNKYRTVRINLAFVIIVFLLFALILFKLFYVCLNKNVDGINLTEFANGRNTKKETIVAGRGTIYDSTGEILAQDVNSYTVIAYLSESRTTDPSRPYHVVDKEYTAAKLAPLINMTKERILNLLNYDAYQVELGPGGRGISELLKEQIEDLELPGIDFIKSVKRYYPNTDFLSYTIGYAKTNEKTNNITGEMGIELEYNDILTGKNGYKEYQQDMYGYKIANTPENVEKSVNGSDVYLTVDTNIQMFAEQAVTTIESVGVEWATVSVVDAKTGAILAVASSPGFDPNTKEITSYYDPFVSYVYEPGSVMKIFSFLATMENGLYDGKATYPSGTIKVDDATIKDWNDHGWGTITFNQGFMASSNTAATRLAQKLGRQKLYEFYNKLGFGTPTGITLPNEQNGVINFKYNTEIASASFGQGISVTAIQMIRALTAIANDGTTLEPYIVSKIVDKNTEKITYEGKRTVANKVATKKNVDAIKDLMRGVIDGRETMSTGKSYNVKGLDVIGKTGTAQIASPTGGYLKGTTNYIRSFAGLFPGDDPEVIVYAAVSKIKNSTTLPKAIKTLMEDTGSYLGIHDTSEESEINQITLGSYKNKLAVDVEKTLEDNKINTIIIGDGTRIIDQYPKSGSIVSQNDKVFLLTNGTNFVMPNMIGWSRSDVNIFAGLTNIRFNYTNYGYVISTSKNKNEKITFSDSIDVVLEPKYKTLEEAIEEEENL